MTAEVSADLAAKLRATHETKLQLYRSLLEEGQRGDFFDVVVITSADKEQTLTYETNIASMQEAGRIPKQADYVVVPDPPGTKVGCGGATFYVLAELHKRYGSRAGRLRVLLIHAGGYSKRLPNHSHCGKIYSLLPVPSPKDPKAAMSMLEMKLVTFTHVAQQMPKEKGGVFVTCSDDIIFYDHSVCDFSNSGFTAFGHPSSVEIGKDHGVFVLEDPAQGREGGVAPCKKFIHKYPVEKQREEGAVVGKTESGHDEVYTDSCYFMSSDLAEAMRVLFVEGLGSTVLAEIDAYGDFMQCTGSARSRDFMHGFGNVAKAGDTGERAVITGIRGKLFDALAGFTLNCLVLPGSRFYHVGTMKEALHHFCEDDRFLTCLGSGQQKNGACVIESIVNANAKVQGPSVIEYSRVSSGATVQERSILSGITCPAAVTLPKRVFLQTLPVRKEAVGAPGGAGISYVTHILGTGDDLKKHADDILLFGEFSVTKHLKVAGSIWAAKIYPLRNTAAESFAAALEMYDSLSQGKAPECWTNSHLVSLAECVTGKDLPAQAAMRKQLLSEL
ncbi:Bifunctional fucokinase/fucose pyrophosphorylase [Diplonema papillatum]|nr:Bifunctional fucokinase/fucose pyrophosphorylase [Diplonema papillatum]